MAFGRNAVLIIGPSGSGKSGLALQLMAVGARLIADDGVILRPRDGVAVATAPAPLRGLIEARGVGLLAADAQASGLVRLVADLGHTEDMRLPPRRYVNLVGCKTELVHNSEFIHFASAIRQYLIGGRRE